MGGRNSYYDGTVSPAWIHFEKKFAEGGVAGIISPTISVNEARMSPLEYPSLVWMAAPEMTRGARLIANGTRIEANGNTWAFDVVPKIELNRSYYDQTSIAFLGMQPLTVRGTLQEQTFVARTIWPEAFRLDDCAPFRHVDATAQAIRRLVREESAGGARSARARIRQTSAL